MAHSLRLLAPRLCVVAVSALGVGCGDTGTTNGATGSEDGGDAATADVGADAAFPESGADATSPETSVSDAASGADCGVGDAEQCGPGFATSVISVNYGTNGGFNQGAMPAVVLGPPRGGGVSKGSTDVVSLGLGGEIVLGFDHDIVDGPGPDLIVFENPFEIGGATGSVFVEPGEVSVSSDGVQWISFPCDLGASPYSGCAGLRPVLSTPENCISPFDPEAAGGDAFDLATIGVSKAHLVRIRGGDIVQGANGMSGFDLDAVSVIHPDCP